jgi:hypothetical protein
MALLQTVRMKSHDSSSGFRGVVKGTTDDARGGKSGIAAAAHRSVLSLGVRLTGTYGPWFGGGNLGRLKGLLGNPRDAESAGRESLRTRLPASDESSSWVGVACLTTGATLAKLVGGKFPELSVPGVLELLTFMSLLGAWRLQLSWSGVPILDSV